MNRRQSLLYLSAIAGHALFSDVVTAFARSSAAIAQAPASWQPVLVSPAQGRALEEVVEAILPQTDTPGARAARVHVFVDLAARDCLAPTERQALVAGLDRLGADFPGLAPIEKQRRLEAMDKAAFAVLKDLTLLGFFTSEIGCTQALAYEAVPGAYRGCLDLKPGQRAWATR